MEDFVMATLVLNNVPEKLLSELEQLAAREHLPVEEKTVQLLQQAIRRKPSTRPSLSAEEWVAELRAWAASHKPLPFEADDDRDSIYAGRGE
jgi:plasmid stability protein